VYRRIHFFNGFHNGDIHVSREFVRWIVKNVPAEEYVYSHKNSQKLIMDVEGIAFNNNMPRPDQSDWFLDNDILYINTWFRTIPRIHDKCGCGLQCLFLMFEENLKKLGIELPTGLVQYIPNIDYEKYEIGNARKYLDGVSERNKVFISNGMVMSGQATNFDFNPIIHSLAIKYKDVVFFLSNGNNEVALPNVVYTKDIIQSRNNDLNENAYIAKFCSIIVGRASGPHAFCWNTDNLNKTVIDFSMDNKTGTFGLYMLYPDGFVHYPRNEPVEMGISKEIERVFRHD
jgi:hypothetical protein